MPLPTQVADRLGWETPKTPGWGGQLLMFTGTILIATVLVYFGLLYGVEPYLQNQINLADKQIDGLKTQVPPDDQKLAAQFYSQVANLQKLFKNQTIGSPFLTWLGATTQSNVFYTRLSLDIVQRKASLTATARTLDDVNQQLQLFSSKPEVRQVVFSNATANDTGGWDFSFTLTLDPSVLTPH
jgi:hypothetical protein